MTNIKEYLTTHKAFIGGIETKRTYRPSRIICDVITLVMIIMLTKLGFDLAHYTGKFLGALGMLVPLGLPAAGFALCAAYAVLSFRGMKFGRLKITKQNAQNVYNWWTFSMALIKIPMLMAMFEGIYIFREWAAVGESTISIIPLILYVLIAAAVTWFSVRRTKFLAAVKEQKKNDSAVKVKVKIADDENNEK